jgi:hypothetical protein
MKAISNLMGRCRDEKAKAMFTKLVVCWDWLQIPRLLMNCRLSDVRAKQDSQSLRLGDYCTYNVRSRLATCVGPTESFSSREMVYSALNCSFVQQLLVEGLSPKAAAVANADGRALGHPTTEDALWL